MPYALFHTRCPELAVRETRNITVLENSDLGLPADHYAFLEMYCDEVGCDCRRVMFYVVSASRGTAVQAVISWGWEPREFYAKWMRDSDPLVVDSLKGPALNIGSPETELAPALLDLVRNVLLRDPAYADRIKQHYSIFRKKIDSEDADVHVDRDEVPKSVPPQATVGPNHRCPCGSGKKYKKCCGRF